MLEDFLNWLRQNEGATEGFRGPFFPRLPPPVPPMPGPPSMMGIPRAPQGYGGMGPLQPVPPGGDGSTPEGEPELPFGLNPQTLSPFARSMMPPIPGVGPMTRNPDQYFAEANQPTRISVGKPQRQPVPAGASPQMAPPGPWQHTLPPPQPSATTSAPPQPAMAPWGQRNSGWLEPLSDALVGMGAGIAQTPAGSSPLTYLSQGSASAAQNIGTADDRRLKRQLLKAEIGEKEAKGDIRKQAAEIARGLPADHPARGFFALGLVEKGLEHLTPDYNKLIVVGPDGKPKLNETLVNAKAFIQAAQGSMKWQEIGKDPSGNAKWGYPPTPQLPGAQPPRRAAGPQTAQTTPGTPQGPGVPAPLAPGATGYTKGQEKQDTAFAEDAVKWKQEGRADVAKNVEQLRAIRDRLAKGERLTGPEIGNLPGRVREITNPSAIQAYEQVQEVVQRNLRAILGGQFAQQEGKQLIDRAYNLRLPPEQNADRVARLLTSIEQAARAKEAMTAHFDVHGSLSGYKGPTIEELRESVRAAVRDVAPSPEKKAESSGQRIDSGKKLNGKPVYWNGRAWVTD